MSSVNALRVVDTESGEPLGTIVMDDGTATPHGSFAEGVWRQFRIRTESDTEAFDLLKDGWSNGYVTVEPESSSLS